MIGRIQLKSMLKSVIFLMLFLVNLSLNAQNIDSDGDGILNSVDIDDDNDGIPDVLEMNCSLSKVGQVGSNMILPHINWDNDNNPGVGKLEKNDFPTFINSANSSITIGTGITAAKLSGRTDWSIGGINSADVAQAKSNNDFLQFTSPL
jgi:hypothetical protein